jgi:chaperone BCS1
LLFYEVRQENFRYFEQEKISVTCLGRSSHILKDLLQECRAEYLDRIRNKITIFGHHGAQWKRERVKEARPLSTVILRECEKAPLVEDMKDFLDSRTRSWYARRSIPYRRGYLLYGPPGTGKSSFSLSVAGELGLDIYAVSIPTVDDQSLKSLFEALPENCVVLLEDIDAVDSAHSRDSPADTPASGQGLTTAKKGVSLSGLLNVLDGVASQEDRILIMTTNHINALDAALIRPGRVDKTVRFQLVDQDVAMQIFRYIFEQQRDGPTQDCNDPQRLGVESQAREFARRIPEGKYSPAQVMSYLLQHREAPEVALDNIESWVESTRYENTHEIA